MEGKLYDDPADANMVGQLPESRFRPQPGLRSEEDLKCLICQDDYKANDVLLTLPCFHKFHKRCITEWLGRKACCPIDRKTINS